MCICGMFVCEHASICMHLCIGCVCLVFKFVYMYACVRECLSVPIYNKGSTVWTKKISLENDSVI